MSKITWIVLVSVALVGATFALPSALADDDRMAWVAHLTGAEETPAPVDTKAVGQAHFQLSDDGASIRYKLIVANINNVLMAHIHVRAADQPAGGVVVWLYPAAPPPSLIEGRFQGVLAKGTITQANLVGALAGMTMADLVAALNSGLAYVNVHTSQYPGGEVRGTIYPAD